MACRGSTAASTCGWCTMPAVPSTAITPNPQQHQRSEHLADARRPAALNGKKAEQDRNCHRRDVGLERIGRNIDALERAQYRNCRCDDAVPVYQRRSEQAHDDKGAGTVEPARAGERHQCQDPAFTVVVRAHHEEAVLDGDRDDERPQDQREDTDSGLRGKPSADGLGDRLQGVERARPEVAIDDAERGEGCRRRRAPSGAGGHGTRFRAGGDRHRIRAPSATVADAGYRLSAAEASSSRPAA
jgi:hypothetical protein